MAFVGRQDEEGVEGTKRFNVRIFPQIWPNKEAGKMEKGNNL